VLFLRALGLLYGGLSADVAVVGMTIIVVTAWVEIEEVSPDVKEVAEEAAVEVTGE